MRVCNFIVAAAVPGDTAPGAARTVEGAAVSLDMDATVHPPGTFRAGILLDSFDVLAAHMALAGVADNTAAGTVVLVAVGP